ncbi:MAG: ABC transporter ATP-binding protein [Candidatus Sumerlaeia bacterium]|nr:ABC transporter ATP-binding protein [Candidatus Sumerlaeia bacterium]
MAEQINPGKQKKHPTPLVDAHSRELLKRVLAYAWPHRRSIAFALIFSFLSSFLSAVSILPMIPIIEVILNPEVSLVEQKEAAEPTSPDAAAPEETIGGWIEQNVPVVGSLESWLEQQKEAFYAWSDAFIRSQGAGAIKYVALFLIAAVLMKALAMYVSKYQINKIVFHSTQMMKVDLYEACLNLDFGNLATRTSGNLMSRLSSDIGKVRVIIQAVLNESIIAPFQILFTFLLLIFLSFEVTLILMITLPLVIIPITLFSKRLRMLAGRDAEEDAKLMDLMQETILGLAIVKAFHAEPHEKKRFRTTAREQLDRQLKRTRLAIAAPVITEVMTTIAIAVVLSVGVYLVVVKQEMKATSFLVYLGLLSQMLKPLKGMAEVWMRLQRGLASAERVFELVDQKPSIQEAENPVLLKPIEREIRFEDVWFRYDNTRDDVLRGVDLTIKKGQVVAIVGETGSGKTTISRLIPRFYDPTQGRITLDGVDLKDASFASLREQISIVTQETILFSGSIYSNIAYGNREASKEEVIAAAKAANAHDFIMSFPEGYETRVGERGNKLSGGQRQRIAIARAILKNSPILILDEATSALDNESQALVQQALDRLMAQRTVIVIAHRLSTIRNADCIVVLKDGRVVEMGSHQELLQVRESSYFRLFNKEQIEIPTV